MITRLSDNDTQFYIRATAALPQAQIKLIENTRFGRWEAGLLPSVPVPIEERDLDICLMKQSRRRVQKGGHLQFQNLMYRGEYLGGYDGETVNLRFNPRDITTVLVYRQENSQEVFLTRAHAQSLETEQLSLDEAEVAGRRLSIRIN